ncbi:RICIN domain-containing protein [Streptomyces sp. NRRL S-1022]|uniref:RICIN domain-containing protein n=1 Tax=Streptomyces sp. NRRL S-1022 TaxID=1463880 RepID=UPI002D21C968|nr:RICIN domain-containing protein [Streptomyces sp. NRRL S-1022]
MRRLGRGLVGQGLRQHADLLQRVGVGAGPRRDRGPGGPQDERLPDRGRRLRPLRRPLQHTITNDTQAELWDCTASRNQSWTYTTRKEFVVYGNKCLDAYNAAATNGTQLVLWSCGDRGAALFWL